MVVSIICINPGTVETMSWNTASTLETTFSSVFSTNYFCSEVLDFTNIKIIQVILKNPSFQLFLRIFQILISWKQPHITGASDRSFQPIFNKKLDHLEILLTICRPKKVLSAGSLCWPLVSSPQSKRPKRTSMLPQNHHASVSNMLWKPLKYFM